jgi:hypothetical protein
MTETDFGPAYSTRVESVLRETMSDRDDEAVKDGAAAAAASSACYSGYGYGRYGCYGYGHYGRCGGGAYC